MRVSSIRHKRTVAKGECGRVERAAAEWAAKSLLLETRQSPFRPIRRFGYFAIKFDGAIIRRSDSPGSARQKSPAPHRQCSPAFVLRLYIPFVIRDLYSLMYFQGW